MSTNSADNYEYYNRVAYILGRRATSREQNPWRDALSPDSWRYSLMWKAGYDDRIHRPDEWQFRELGALKLFWWRLKIWIVGVVAYWLALVTVGRKATNDMPEELQVKKPKWP
jgi:hypothetical protein